MAPRVAGRAEAGVVGAPLQPPPLKGAYTVGTVSLMIYLYIVHSFKLDAASVVLTVGLLGICLFVRPLRISPSLMWYGAFLGWALVTLPLSNYKAEAWDSWIIAFKLWLIVFLAYNAIKTPGQLRLIMLTWLVVFALYPVRGTLLNFLFGYSTFGRYAWNFTFANFNDLSAYTLIPLGFAVDRLRSAEAKWVKLGALGGLILLPFITLLTQSR
ncbi:MAG: hypothetical protein H7Z40_13715, partial [Phycisphaerae bacterium]|nr:hypothetical protein [Gemmatimonadaceae bacterium]